MPTIGPYSTAFTLTIDTSADGPFSLWDILSTGIAPSGCTLGGAINVFGARPTAYLSVQTVTGGTVYLGGEEVSPTNAGLAVPSGAVNVMSPGSGEAWINGVWFTADADATVVNFWVIYK